MRLPIPVILLLALISLIVFPSCHSAEEEKEEHCPFDWDAYPIELIIKVVNEAGQDILDKSVTDNILNEKMTLTIDRLTTEVAMSKPYNSVGMSRTYLPTWYGAYIWQIDGDEKYYCIVIGEFDGALNGRRSMDLTLCGQKYELSFTNSVTYDGKNQKHNFDRCFYLDGKLIQSGGSPIGTYIITLNR